MRRVGALIACAAAPWACSSYSDPALRVTGVTVRERTADAAVLDIELEAENRNEVPLPLKELEYTVRLNGREVFRGFRSPEATLRRFGTQSLRVPAVVRAAAMPEGGAAECRVDGSLAYTTPGELAQVLFESDVQRPTVGFSDSRSLELGGR